MRTSPTAAQRDRPSVSELTLFLIRVAFLAILWIFVLSAISVIRSDMFGARVPETARGAEARKEKKGVKPPPKRRGSPSHVIVTEGSNVGERAELDQAPILIGRGSDAAIRLDDDYVSTRHARIAASGDQWFVEDLGSTNGTYIGTVRITQPTTITLGTQVRIGKTILELRK
jgi:pSer/pThr/pTyr-binding forkhead associated (FHA) protein